MTASLWNASPVLTGWRTGNSRRVGGMKVFPLFCATPGRLSYLWAGDAMQSGDVIVEDGHGEQKLQLTNRGSSPVFFPEGLVLDRGHQNRGLNASMMIPGSCEVYLAVSCVEKGRNSGDSTRFSCSGTFVPPRVRSTLKNEVSSSLSRGAGHSTNRNNVWGSISDTLDATQTHSRTESVIEAHRHHADDLASYGEQLSYRKGASGIAIAIGSDLVLVELFDSPAICARVWRPLVEAAALSALDVEKSATPPHHQDVDRLLAAIAAERWTERDAKPGLGKDCRATWEHYAGSALVVDAELIHASIILAA